MLRRRIVAHVVRSGTVYCRLKDITYHDAPTTAVLRSLSFFFLAGSVIV